MPTSASPHPSIADYGLIGDCRTAALVSRVTGVRYLKLDESGEWEDHEHSSWPT
jgi:hypothetical protein